LQGIRYLDFLPERRDHPLLFPRYVAVLRGEDDGAEVEIPYNTRGISGWMRNAVTRLDSERIAVSFADISAAKAAETRRTLLLDIADRLRSAPGAAAAYAAEVLGRHLGACRLGYGEVSADGSTLTIAQEHVAPGLPSAVGTHMLDAFGTALAAELRAGRTVTITDVAEDPRTRSEAAAHLAFGSRAVLAVPLLRGGRLRATLHVSRPEPRPWSAEEVALVEDVAARIWSTLEQARAEDALREGEERLRLATGAAEVGFWDVDLVNDVLVWPPIVKAMFGISADAPVSMADFYAGLHPEDREATTTAFAAACDPVRRALYDVEYRTVGKEDGIIRWVAAKGRGVFDEAGRAVRVIGAALDITARKAAEAALREREAEAREAQRLARVGSWRWDAATDATTGSDELYRIYGLDPASGPFPDFSAQRGTLYPEAEWDRIAAAVRHAVETGEGYALDVRALRNGAPIWVTTRCEVLRDAAGRVTALRGTVQDITERRTAEEALATREAELRRLNETLEVRVREEIAAREAAQAQLAHAQRMEALGQLAGGIAHDINNVLQAVGGGAALIERKPGEPDHVRRIARMVIEAAERGSAVTRRLLAFSRRADLRAESLDPVMLLTDLRDMLAHTMGAGIGVRVEAPPRLPTVLADKGQLETVLVNLAANARDAMDGQGTITLSAALETRRAMQAIGDPPMLKPGRYVRLAVHDTGAGMTPEVLARATEPFFTTKPRGKGTGLGLAMARGFAEQSGGGLRLDSEPGRGTVVSLWLPLAVAVAPADETPSPPAAPAHGRRILIVDDDAAVREVTAGGLEAAGYAVLTAGDGPAALEIIKRDDRVDLLISDLSMPGMDGLAVIAAAQSLRPGLPAILLTGYATNAAELALDGAMSGAFSLLRKPIAIAPLAERVAAVLEGVPAGQG
jgi:PAS domain S-box-containing protein